MTGKTKKREQEEAVKHTFASAADAINKKFGSGSIMTLSSKVKVRTSVLPTGLYGLDIALGVGGLPRGRVIEIFGGESSGKTTLGMHFAGCMQAVGGSAAVVDAEHALDPEWASTLGVDTDQLLVSQPDTGEDALDIVSMLVNSGTNFVMLDSVAALVSKAELTGSAGDSYVGVQARMMSQALRKIAGEAARSGSIVVFINQTREKIGVMFGNPETTPGGRALKFWSSLRIRSSYSKLDSGPYAKEGIVQHLNIVKNKVAPPFKKTDLHLIPGIGYDHYQNLMMSGMYYGLITKNGSYCSCGDLKWQRDTFTGELAETITSMVVDTIKDDTNNPVIVPGADTEVANDGTGWDVEETLGVES